MYGFWRGESGISLSRDRPPGFRSNEPILCNFAARAPKAMNRTEEVKLGHRPNPRIYEPRFLFVHRASNVSNKDAAQTTEGTFC